MPRDNYVNTFIRTSVNLYLSTRYALSLSFKNYAVTDCQVHKPTREGAAFLFSTPTLIG